MADTRWRLSQAATSQLLELLWQIWDLLNRKFRFSDGPNRCRHKCGTAPTAVSFMITTDISISDPIGAQVARICRLRLDRIPGCLIARKRRCCCPQEKSFPHFALSNDVNVPTYMSLFSCRWSQQPCAVEPAKPFAMSDASALHDQVFRFVAFRQHSFFFYRVFNVDYLALQQYGAPFPPALQEARVGQLQIDQLGRDLSDQLRLHCRHIMTRANIFQYVAHRPLVRPGQVLVRLEYLSPARPHLTVFASVCRSWNASISRVTQDHNMVDYRRLSLESQRRHILFYWSHSFHEDRFTYFADLIPEMQLLLIRSPVQ